MLGSNPPCMAFFCFGRGTEGRVNLCVPFQRALKMRCVLMKCCRSCSIRPRLFFCALCTQCIVLHFFSKLPSCVRFPCFYFGRCSCVSFRCFRLGPTLCVFALLSLRLRYRKYSGSLFSICTGLENVLLFLRCWWWCFFRSLLQSLSFSSDS